MAGSSNMAPACRFSGVKISNHTLVVVTLKRAQDGSLRLCPERCRIFELAGRQQPELTDLFSEVLAFLRAASIEYLVVRGSPARGTHRGSGLGFKIEAILQLLPGITVEVVPSMTVTSWDQRVDPELPPPDPQTLGYTLSRLQTEAILVAAWAEAQATTVSRCTRFAASKNPAAA